MEGGPAPSQSTERSSGADRSDSANQRASGSERHTSDSGDLRRQGSVSQEAAASAGLSMLQAAVAKAGGAMQIAALGSPKGQCSVLLRPCRASLMILPGAPVQEPVLRQRLPWAALTVAACVGAAVWGIINDTAQA